MTSADLYLATAYAQRYMPGSNLDENRKYADLAVQTFEKVLDKSPTDKTAIAGLAGIYQKSSQFDRARDAYIRNTQTDPENHIPFYGVGSGTGSLSTIPCRHFQWINGAD